MRLERIPEADIDAAPASATVRVVSPGAHGDTSRCSNLESARAHYVAAMANWNMALDERDRLGRAVSRLRETLRLVSEQIGSHTDAGTILRDREPWLFATENHDSRSPS